MVWTIRSCAMVWLIFINLAARSWKEYSERTFSGCPYGEYDHPGFIWFLHKSLRQSSVHPDPGTQRGGDGDPTRTYVRCCAGWARWRRRTRPSRSPEGNAKESKRGGYADSTITRQEPTLPRCAGCGAVETASPSVQTTERKWEALAARRKRVRKWNRPHPPKLHQRTCLVVGGVFTSQSGYIKFKSRTRSILALVWHTWVCSPKSFRMIRQNARLDHKLGHDSTLFGQQ